VHGSSDPVGLDLLPVHAAIRSGRLLPAAGPERVEDPLALRTLMLHLRRVFGSGVVFYLQSWCISMRGPLYSAMFTPLCTVLTTALSAIVLHEELHIGSLLGAVAVVAGLYVVLWGKAEDARKGRAPGQSKDSTDRAARSDAQFDMEDTTLAAPLLADAARAQAPS
ncbi:unnamed protein product, partial [Urochloa humidicola]